MGTITKALKLLSHFSSDRAEIGLAAFVRLSGGDKATVRRHLVELEENGFLEQNSDTRSYRLGPSVLRLASLREQHFPTRRIIAPIIDRMADQLGELVHASLLQGNVMSPVYHSDPGRHTLGVIFDEGELLPLHATASGLTMMAFGPEGIADTALAGKLSSYAPNTVITRSDILHMVGQFRKCGFGYSDEFFTRDIVSFGMPLYGADGEAFGTIAVALPRARLTDELKSQILSSLRDGCEAITRSCGGSIPQYLKETWDRYPDGGQIASDQGE